MGVRRMGARQVRFLLPVLLLGVGAGVAAAQESVRVVVACDVPVAVDAGVSCAVSWSPDESERWDVGWSGAAVGNVRQLQAASLVVDVPASGQGLHLEVVVTGRRGGQIVQTGTGRGAVPVFAPPEMVTTTTAAAAATTTTTVSGGGSVLPPPELTTTTTTTTTTMVPVTTTAGGTATLGSQLESVDRLGEDMLWVVALVCVLGSVSLALAVSRAAVRSGLGRLRGLIAGVFDRGRR